MSAIGWRGNLADIVQSDESISFDRGVFHLFFLNKVSLVDDLDRILPRGSWRTWRADVRRRGSLNDLAGFSLDVENSRKKAPCCSSLCPALHPAHNRSMTAFCDPSWLRSAWQKPDYAPFPLTLPSVCPRLESVAFLCHARL